MKKQLEKIGLLSLSLILVSSFSISSALVQMRTYYTGRGYTTGQVDLLLSIPAFAILGVVFLHSLLPGGLPQRVMITGGLLLYSLAGLIPIFIQAYPVVLGCRVLLGIGSGMVNTQAISIISERYDGQERTKLLGYRGAVEALGNAILTFLAGLLLAGGWTRSFWIYSAGLPVLLVYLLVIPKESKRKQGKYESNEFTPSACTKYDRTESGKAGRTHLTWRELWYAIRCAAMCFLMIGSSTVLTMRLAVLMVEKQIGTDTQASMIMSLMIIASILSGIFYGRIKKVLQRWFTPVLLLLTAIGMVLVCMAGSLASIGGAGILFGAAYPIVVTDTFGKVAEGLPEAQVERGTNIALAGCNLGAFLTTYIIRLTEMLSGRNESTILLFAGVVIVIAGITIVSMNGHQT